MTRKELITSDEYIKVTTECIIRSCFGIKTIRKEIDERWIKHKNELIEMFENEIIKREREVIARQQNNFKDY